jgi:hypothetical protein
MTRRWRAISIFSTRLPLASPCAHPDLAGHPPTRKQADECRLQTSRHLHPGKAPKEAGSSAGQATLLPLLLLLLLLEYARTQRALTHPAGVAAMIVSLLAL